MLIGMGLSQRVRRVTNAGGPLACTAALVVVIGSDGRPGVPSAFAGGAAVTAPGGTTPRSGAGTRRRRPYATQSPDDRQLAESIAALYVAPPGSRAARLRDLADRINPGYRQSGHTPNCGYAALALIRSLIAGRPHVARHYQRRLTEARLFRIVRKAATLLRSHEQLLPGHLSEHLVDLPEAGLAFLRVEVDSAPGERAGHAVALTRIAGQVLVLDNQEYLDEVPAGTLEQLQSFRDRFERWSGARYDLYIYEERIPFASP